MTSVQTAPSRWGLPGQPETMAGPRPVLSVFAAMMITVGIVVGAGIFQTPALVANIAGSPLLMFAAWVLGGALSFMGALTYAELASVYPSAGGEYTFLTRAYGRNLSFLFAWARTMVIVTGSIALIGFILGDYLSHMWSLGPYSSPTYAALAVIFLGVAVQDYLKAEGKMTPARQAWLRVAFIFAGVSIGLYAARVFLTM